MTAEYATVLISTIEAAQDAFAKACAATEDPEGTMNAILSELADAAGEEVDAEEETEDAA
jgi:hypothetical protein